MAEKRKRVAPNEASWLRWIAFIIVGLLIGAVISMPLEILIMIGPYFLLQGVVGELLEPIRLFNNFVGMFIGTIISLRLVAKTTVREFIYGVGGKGCKKQNLLVLGLYLLGMVISALPFAGNFTLREVGATKYLVSLIVVILFTWMQTSWEEIVFRGVFIRFACKNNISNTKKAVVWGLISSIMFMLIHTSNPEVLNQSGLQVVLACLPYFLSGIGLYFADIYFKSLMPGLIIHWVNNFVSFTIFSSVVAVGGFPSLLVDNTPPTGLYYLVTTVLCYAPLYVYILVKELKKRKA